MAEKDKPPTSQGAGGHNHGSTDPHERRETHRRIADRKGKGDEQVGKS